MFHHEGGVEVGDVDSKVKYWAYFCLSFNVESTASYLHRLCFMHFEFISYLLYGMLSICELMLKCCQALKVEIPIEEKPTKEQIKSILRSVREEYKKLVSLASRQYLAIT